MKKIGKFTLIIFTLIHVFKTLTWILFADEERDELVLTDRTLLFFLNPIYNVFKFSLLPEMNPELHMNSTSL